jgi:hypothetical protein
MFFTIAHPPEYGCPLIANAPDLPHAAHVGYANLSIPSAKNGDCGEKFSQVDFKLDHILVAQTDDRATAAIADSQPATLLGRFDPVPTLAPKTIRAGIIPRLAAHRSEKITGALELVAKFERPFRQRRAAGE